MRKSQDFTKGPLFAPLLRFAVPTLAAHFLQTMYGAVDMLIVGQFADASDAAAISTGSWIMAVVTSFVVGVSVGTTVLLGRKLGEGKKDELGRIIGASVELFAAMALVITAVAVPLAPEIGVMMKTPPEAMDAAVDYIRICAAGCVCILAYNVVGSVFRGMGNSTVPLITVAIACGVNIVGDLILVAGLGLAARGAAIATVAAQLVSVVLSVAIARKKKLLTLRRGDLSLDTKLIRRIVGLGLPVAMQETLVNMSFLVLTAIVNSLGDVVISAGVGVAEKLCGFVLLAPSAFSQTMTTVVAQNMGAGKPKRAKKALLYGIAASFSVGVVMAYLAFFHGDMLSAIFNRNREVCAVSAEYLKAYAIDTLLVSVMFCMVGYFEGCGRTLFPMAQGILGAFGVRIPVSYIMGRRVPVNVFHIGLATPASSVVQVLLCVGYYLWLKRSESDTEGRNYTGL